jgi:hypothetical protein
MDIIEDIRKQDQFKTFTFSKYQKSSVKKEWMNSMIKSNVESSCYWTTELVCSGLFTDLWDLILLFYAKYIHCGNPKIPAYLDLRFDTFKQEASKEEELQLRNNLIIRKIFVEMVCILCKSPRKHSYDSIDIGKDTSLVKSRLIAPTIEFNKAFKSSDPKELFIPMNEFGYTLHTKNCVAACYWIEWILLFLSKHKCVAVERDYCAKCKTDGIWLVWEMLSLYAPNPISKKIMESLIHLFCIAYTPSVKDKRKFLLYYAVSLCCDTISMDTDLIQDKKIIELAYEKCWLMYKDIRKHEIS